MAEGRHFPIVKALYVNEKNYQMLIKFGAQKQIPIKMVVISLKFKIFEFKPPDVRNFQNIVFTIPQHNFSYFGKKNCVRMKNDTLMIMVMWPK